MLYLAWRLPCRYLSYVLYPLVIGYAIYTLIYETHKSWYSWILNSLVGAVYTFGFILMCPQASARAARPGCPCCEGHSCVCACVCA